MVPALLVLPLPALAHGEHGLITNWLVWALALSLLGYLIGLIRCARLPAAWRIILFVLGWGTLAISVIGPVDAWAHASLPGHMVQHMVLLAVAPPLLLLARPMPQYMLALPLNARRRVGPWLGRVYTGTAATPVTAFLAHGLVIWLWHLPLPFQFVLEHQLIHDGVHVLFFGTGLWFWWSLIAPGRLGQGSFGSAAVLAVLTMMHTGMLGALMTFAPQLLYPEHPAGFAGFDQLSDQQLAGLFMWVPGGLIYTAAALALTGLWLRVQTTGRGEM
ncbi:MAG: cytochrome c oxidase assembly protein [Wenzhouxiangella sp.]|nr:cytochrome c oxidase assembly protein [Wenzhouxiangella sp.]